MKRKINLNKRIKLAALAGFFVLFSCNNDNFEQPVEVEYSWDFESDISGWIGGFADFPVGEEEQHELLFKVDSLPEPLDQNKKVITLSGFNKSDDLFMFVKKKITGLNPGTIYYVSFTVEFASNVPENLIIEGGSPGDSVFVKAGVSQHEPLSIPDEHQIYRMNIDKGNHGKNGENMIVIGDFSNGTELDVYTLKTVQNEHPVSVTADENGGAWIIIGTDSGFEGTTTISYNSVKARFF